MLVSTPAIMDAIASLGDMELAAAAQTAARVDDPQPVLETELLVPIWNLHDDCGVKVDSQQILRWLSETDERTPDHIKIGKLQTLHTSADEAAQEIKNALSHHGRDSSRSEAVEYSVMCESRILEFFAATGLTEEQSQSAFGKLAGDNAIGTASVNHFRQLQDHAEHIAAVSRCHLYLATHMDDPEAGSQIDALSEWLYTSINNASDAAAELEDIVLHAVSVNDASALRHERITELAHTMYRHCTDGEPMSEETLTALGNAVRSRVREERKAIVDHAAIAKAEIGELRADDAGRYLLAAGADSTLAKLQPKLKDVMCDLAGNVLTRAEIDGLVWRAIERHHDAQDEQPDGADERNRQGTAG